MSRGSILLRRVYRLLLGLPLLLLGGGAILCGAGWDRLRGRPPLLGAGRKAQALWCRALCRLFGIDVHTEGNALLPPPVLVVANHISWLDIVCLSAVAPVVFLSKAEVRRWPLVGRVATLLGTRYIERGSRCGASHAVAALGGALADGYRAVLFAEGTTSSGTAVRPFRARLYQAAVDNQTAVQPLTICYRTVDGTHCPAAAFVGDQTLGSSVWALAGVARLDATLLVHPPLQPKVGRSQLARASRDVVAQGLERLLGQPPRAPAPADAGPARHASGED